MYVSGLVLFWIRTVQDIPLECENKVSKLNKISKLILNDDLINNPIPNFKS